MTIVLVNLHCPLCSSECWSLVPLLAVDQPVQCGVCQALSACAKPDIAMYVLPSGSPLESEWYAQFPEAVMEDRLRCP